VTREAVPEPAAVLARILASAQRKSDALAQELHPTWLEHGLRKLALVTAASPAAERSTARALAALYNLRWPGLDRFTLPAHRIALLPRPDLRRLLAAVALHAERGRVRISIGPGVRGALIGCVGQEAYGQMVAAPPPLKGVASRALTPAEADPERLAAAGATRLVEAGAWRSGTLLRWVQIALGPTVRTTSPAVATTAAQDTREALERLPIYFPEHAWLFGSPTDQALSASPTA